MLSFLKTSGACQGIIHSQAGSGGSMVIWLTPQPSQIASRMGVGGKLKFP